METPQEKTIPHISSLPLICPLCLRSIALEDLCAHLEMHQRAEVTADLLALSRR